MTGRIDFAAVNAACRKVAHDIVNELQASADPEGITDFVGFVAVERDTSETEAARWLATRYRLNGTITSSAHVGAPTQLLFGADTLSRPGKVLIVRDLECAAVAKRLYPNSPALTFAGDPAALDWSALSDRIVLVWLNGRTADRLVPCLLKYTAAVAIVTYPDAVPPSWNIMQAENEGWDRKTIAKFIHDNATQAEEYLALGVASFDAALNDETPLLDEVPVPAYPLVATPEGDQRPTADPTVPSVTVDELISKYILVTKGTMIADRTHPRTIMPMRDFDGRYAAHVEYLDKATVPITRLWFKDPRRATVETIGFKPSAPRIYKDGAQYIFNLYEPPQWPQPDDFTAAQPFLDHMDYLIPDQAQRNDLLDWLAHAVQYPEVRPHRHFLLYAGQEGTGRSWLAYLLNELYAPHAGDCDMHRVMESDFNGELSGKILMAVHEVQAPPSERYQHRNALKSLLTAETLTINQKFLTPWTEKFYCRFLMFTNRVDALPMSETDRRVEAIDCATWIQSADYYTRLYAIRQDPEFRAAVWWWFKSRDLTKFNPAQRANLSDLKAEMVAELRPEDQTMMLEIIRACPYLGIPVGDVIKLVSPKEEREARDAFMKRSAFISRGIRDAGIARSRKKYRIGTDVVHLWMCAETKDMGYSQIRESALRARGDFEIYGWDADKLLDYWESKSQPAGQKSAPGGRESSEGEGGSSLEPDHEPEGEEI